MSLGYTVSIIVIHICVFIDLYICVCVCIYIYINVCVERFIIVELMDNVMIPKMPT